MLFALYSLAISVARKSSRICQDVSLTEAGCPGDRKVREFLTPGETERDNTADWSRLDGPGPEARLSRTEQLTEAGLDWTGL